MTAAQLAAIGYDYAIHTQTHTHTKAHNGTTSKYGVQAEEEGERDRWQAKSPQTEMNDLGKKRGAGSGS